MSASLVSVQASRSCGAPPPRSGELRGKLAELLPQLRLRALKLCRDRDAADDLLQETALRALSFESSYQPDTNLKAWLYQILFSVFITRCRRRRRSGRFHAEHGADPNLWCSSTEPARPNEGLSPPVQQAIRALPEHFGKVVILVDLQEMSYGEAAAELGVPIGTVMSRLHRGRRLLASRLAPANETTERSAA